MTIRSVACIINQHDKSSVCKMIYFSACFLLVAKGKTLKNVKKLVNWTNEERDLFDMIIFPRIQYKKVKMASPKIKILRKQVSL